MYSGVMGRENGTGMAEGSRAVGREPRPRRTQAERRAATREALLDATIASIVEDGYANTTMRRIAERAGVSPGAAQHHFGSKSELVAAAFQHLIVQLGVEQVRNAPPPTASLQQRREQIVDDLWELHKGPLFLAAMELWVAARTDPELRARLAPLQRDQGPRNAVGAAFVLPELAAHPDFVSQMVTDMATMRGLALLSFVSGDDPEQWWPATRARMIAASARLIGDETDVGRQDG